MSLDRKWFLGYDRLIGWFLWVSISANILLFAVLSHQKDLISSYWELVDKYENYIAELLNQDFNSINDTYLDELAGKLWFTDSWIKAYFLQKNQKVSLLKVKKWDDSVEDNFGVSDIRVDMENNILIAEIYEFKAIKYIFIWEYDPTYKWIIGKLYFPEDTKEI